MCRGHVVYGLLLQGNMKCFRDQHETAVEDTLPTCAREYRVHDVESKAEDLRIPFEGVASEHGYVSFFASVNYSILKRGQSQFC